MLPVIITYANAGYISLAKNLITNLGKTLQYHSVCFYCLDQSIYEQLKTYIQKYPQLQVKLVQYFKDNSGVSTKQVSSTRYYSSRTFATVTHIKTQILLDALEQFDFIHFIDCDVVCCKEPDAEYYAKYSDYDIVFQYDAGFYSADKLDKNTLYWIWACTGNTTFRKNQQTIDFLHTWDQLQTKYNNRNDQSCLYQYFLDLGIKDIRDYKLAKLYTYPPTEFTNGFWLNRNIGTLKDTYFFHANHVCGLDNKIKLLEKAGFFYPDS